MPKDSDGFAPVRKKNLEQETNMVTLAAEKDRRFPLSHDGNDEQTTLSDVNKAFGTKLMAVVDGSAHLNPTARRSIVSEMRSLFLEQSETFERIMERQARKAKEQSEAHMAFMENVLISFIAVCKPEFPPAHPYHPHPSSDSQGYGPPQPYHPVQLAMPPHSTTPTPQADPESDIHSGLHDEALRHLNLASVSSVKLPSQAKKTWADYSCTFKCRTPSIPSITTFKTKNDVHTYSTATPVSSTGYDDEVVDFSIGQDSPTDIAQAAQVRELWPMYHLHNTVLPRDNVDHPTDHPTDSVHQIRDWVTHNKLLIVFNARTAQKQHTLQTHALHCYFKGIAHQKPSIYTTKSPLSQNQAKKSTKLHPSRLSSFFQQRHPATSRLPVIPKHTLSTTALMQPRQHSISDLFPDHPG